jgi:DNA-directed RNA polymerase specialized sigma24 family protein
MSDDTATGRGICDAANLPSILKSPAAIDRWVREISPDLWRAAHRQRRRLGLARDLVEEIVNETIADVLQTSTWPATNPAAWLESKVMTAANRVAASYGRARCNRPGQHQLPVNDDGLKYVAARPEAGLARVEADDLLSRLDLDQRTALWRHDGLGVAQTEIGGEFGWSRQRIGRFIRDARVKARHLTDAI